MNELFNYLVAMPTWMKFALLAVVALQLMWAVGR